MFEVSSLRTNTSSKSFAPLSNSHVDSRLFKAAPNFNQPLLQFVDGVDFPLVYNTLRINIYNAFLIMKLLPSPSRGIIHHTLILIFCYFPR